MSLGCSKELSEDVAQNATVHKVGNFGVCVQSADNLEGLAGISVHSDHLSDTHYFTKVESERLLACEAEALGIFTSQKLERKDSHAEQVASMNSLIGLSNHSFYTLHVGTLCGPITRGA